MTTATITATATITSRRHGLAAGLLSIALVAAAPRVAGAAPVDGYLGLLMAGGRPAGMAGAYVGLGEGIAGEPFNPAAVAQWDRRLERGWDWDGTLTWFVPTPGALSRIDVDNDGRNDGGLSGFGNVLGGLSGQYGRLGAGLTAQSVLLSQRTTGLATQQVGLSRVSLSLGWSGWRGALVLGGGLVSHLGTFEWLPPGSATARDQASYAALTFRLGGLWRPRGRAWRVGGSLQTGKSSGVSGLRGTLPVGAPTAFEFPWQVAVGASCWIGPNARRFNEPPPLHVAEHPERVEGPAWEPSDRAPVVLSVQLDLVGRSTGAISLASALDGSSVRSGARASLVPRAGAEWDWIPDRFRIRAGVYLEPSRTGASPRPHGTLGLEQRIPFWPWDLQLSGGADLADRFNNVSLSIGFWSSLAPAPPITSGATGTP